MFLLEKDFYDRVRPIFEKRLGFEMPVKKAINEKSGLVYVDNIAKPKANNTNILTYPKIMS